MSKIPSAHFQMGSWTRCLGGHVFLPFQSKYCFVFSISFLINFGIIYIWPIYQSLDKRMWLTILFFREFHSLQNIDFLSKLWLTFSQSDLRRTELPQCIQVFYLENYDNTICPVLSILLLYNRARKIWLFEKFIFELEASYNFKILVFW